MKGVRGMQRAESKEYAQRDVDSMNRSGVYIPRFCPLIKTKCNTDCVCFMPARYTKAPIGTEYYTYEPQCTNAMFFTEE